MNKFTVIITALIISSVLFSCKGETGPSGIAGVDGSDSAVVVFQNGKYPADSYSGCEDNRLVYNDDNYNEGGCSDLLIGYYNGTSNIYRTLIKFDTSYIVPGNVNVRSAILTFNFDSSGDTAGTTTITAYAVTKPWTEGDSSCSGTADVNSSWLYYDGSSNSWDNDGGDYNGTPLTDPVIVEDDDYKFTLTFNAAGRAVIENWISDPSQNMGIILIATVESGASTGWVMPISSEAVSIAYRPKFTVSYTLP